MTEYSKAEEMLISCLFAERDLKLISAMAGEPISDADAYVLTDGMDPDVESVLYMLSLGILGFSAGWELFPEAVAPRLKGLHRYYQVRNAAGLPWLTDQMSRLKDAGIPMMLTGHLAMRAHYAADIPRMFFEYDITVPSERYDQAKELLRDAVRNADPSSVTGRTIQDITKIRMHSGVPDARFFQEAGLWSRAHKMSYLGCEAAVPSPEDMLISLLCAPFGGWVFEEDRNFRTRRVTDSCRVLRETPDFDFSYLAKQAAGSGMRECVRFYLRLISSRAPDTLRTEAWEPYFPAGESYGKFLKQFLRVARARVNGPAPGAQEKIKTPLQFFRKCRLVLERRRLHRLMLKSEENDA